MTMRLLHSTLCLSIAHNVPRKQCVRVVLGAIEQLAGSAQYVVVQGTIV
jgi:hypothetical protein